MTARPDADPAPATDVAGAGSRRPRPVLLLAAAVIATALVQAFVLQSYFVPTAALAPAVEPGDRVLVWKVRPAADPGDLVVVDTTASATVDRSTPVSDGLIGRVLASVAGWLHVDVGAQSELAVVGSSTSDAVTVTAPVAATVPRDDVVGTVVLRFWPLSRFGTVLAGDAVSASEVDPVAEGQEQEVPRPAADDVAQPGPFGIVTAAVREVVVVVVMALALSFVVKTWLLQAFFIPSGSMEDTLLVGDRVIVSKLTPGPVDLKHGDVVVFQDPGGWLEVAPPVERNGIPGAIHDGLVFVGLLPAESEDHLIKRVIGLPGDHVVCCSTNRKLVVNDVEIDEPYLKPGDLPSSLNFDITVPAGHVWVMGDHRSDSEDSRFHDPSGTGADGSVPIDDITGRAVAVVWPLSRAGWLSDHEETYADVPEATAGP